MKLSYLVDLVSVKRAKKQVTSFEYRRFHYGPFDKDIYTYVEDLIENKLIIAESDYGLTGEEFSVFSINPNKENLADFAKLDDKEKSIMDEVLKSVRGYGAKMLTEIAYRTKPMKSLKATIGGSEHLGRKLKLQN